MLKDTKLIDHSMEKPANNQWKVVRITTFVTMLFILGCFVPAIFGIEGMDGGFAIIVISGFLAICGLVVIVVYRKRAIELNRLIKLDKHIAQWELTQEEWQRFVEIDFKEDKASSKGTFILISVISLIVGILLSIISKDILFLYICLGIIAMIAVPAFTFSRFRHKRKRSAPPLVMISATSVLVGRTYHNWNMLGASLDKVSADENSNPPLLRLVMSYLTRTGLEHYEIRVPVPEQKWSEALRIAAQLKEEN